MSAVAPQLTLPPRALASGGEGRRQRRRGGGRCEIAKRPPTPNPSPATSLRSVWGGERKRRASMNEERNPARNAFVGSPVERVEDLRFLRGRGQYRRRFRRDGLLHAAILRSSMAHGRIRSIDTRRARPHAGRACRHHGGRSRRRRFRPFRCGRNCCPRSSPIEQPVIAHGKVRYVGEPIALVVAESQARRRGRARSDRARDRAAAGGCRPRRRARRCELLFETTGTNCGGDDDGGARRCRCGVRGRRLCAARALPGAAPSPPCRWSRAACSPSGMQRAHG